MDEQRIVCPFCGLPEANAADESEWERLRVGGFYTTAGEYSDRFCWAQLENDWCDQSPADDAAYKRLRAALIEARELRARVVQLEADRAHYIGLVNHNATASQEVATVAERKLREYEQRVAELEAYAADHHALLMLQRKRMTQATALWQRANDDFNVFPDLGELLDWLMLQITNLTAALDANEPCASCHYLYTPDPTDAP